MEFVREVFNNFPQDYDVTRLLLKVFNVECSMWNDRGVTQRCNGQRGIFNFPRNFQRQKLSYQARKENHRYVSAWNFQHGISTWNFQHGIFNVEKTGKRGNVQLQRGT
jgi:hypothetical protein